MQVTGISLKLERTARRVRVKDLAAAMECTPAYISNIESRAVVTDKTANRYLKALVTLPTVATLETPVEAA